MRIDETLLHEQLRLFLKSSDSRFLRAKVGVSLPLGIAIGVFYGSIGLLLLPTIVWTWNGLRVLWSAVTLEAYRTDDGNELLKQPKKLDFLITHMIVMGPQGYGLVIGAFDPDQNRVFPLLANLSREFAILYKDGPKTPAELEIVQMLRDERYRGDYGPRLVPDSYSGDLEAYFFYLPTDLSGAYKCGDTTLVACLGARGERCAFVQVPWSYVAPAIEI